LNQPYTVVQVPVVLFRIDASGNMAKVVGEFAGDDKYLGNMNGTPVNMGPAPLEVGRALPQPAVAFSFSETPSQP
jgi:hypothetical protein